MGLPDGQVSPWCHKCTVSSSKVVEREICVGTLEPGSELAQIGSVCTVMTRGRECPVQKARHRTYTITSYITAFHDTWWLQATIFLEIAPLSHHLSDRAL